MGRRKLSIILLSLLIAYISGYAVCRSTGMVTHYTGYRTDDGNRVVAEHRVDVGGMRDPTAQPRSSIPALIFTPPRIVEQTYWNVVAPAGSPWDNN